MSNWDDKGIELKSFHDMLKDGRQSAGLTFRQLKDKLDHQGTPVSITLLNLVEKNKMKTTYDLAHATAAATGLDVEKALRAAFLSRIQWTVDKEKRSLRRLALAKGLSQAAVKRITNVDVPGSGDE